MRLSIIRTVCFAILTTMCIYSNAQSVTGTLKDSINHPGSAVPGDDIFYKAKLKNPSATDANGVQYNNPQPANTVLQPGTTTSALARNDNYSTFFNTAFNTGNVLTNDFGVPAPTVVTFGTTASNGTTTPAGSPGTTDGGGTLTVNTNGTFSYTPLAGFSGTDKFTYIATTGAVGLPNNDAVVTITVAPDILFSTSDVNPACNGASTGSIAFTGVSGGSGAGYTYSITGALGTYQGSNSFPGLAGGTYNLAVKDGAGYIKTGSTTLTDPPIITYNHTDVNNTCGGGTAGSITFSASGGTGTLTYSITGAGGTYFASPSFTGLTGGTYNLAVQDANGCIVTGSTTLTDPPAVTFTFTKQDITCFGASNGSIVFNTTSGGSGSGYTYSITGTGGPFQSLPNDPNFTGLSANTYTLVVKDGAGCLSATQSTTIIEPGAITVSGTIPNLTYNTAMANAPFTKTGGTGSPTNPWSSAGLPAGVTINTASGVVSGAPTATGSFNSIITYTDINGCTGTTNVSFTVAPKLSDDAYNVVGNTQLVADGQSSPTTPFTASATNIITNDAADVTITITAVTNAATTNGGLITIDANGKFTYTPKAGSTNADSYTYTGTANGVSATAVINFTVTNMIWYVNNTFGGTSDGRSNTPFTNVASAESPSLINQIIYVHTGTGNTTGNALLKSGQTLRGAGSALSVGTLSLAAGTKPTLTGMITLANSVNVDGFDMSTGATTAITSSGATAVTVSIGNVTTSGAVNAVTLTNTTGSVIIAGGSQKNSSGATFNISGGTVSLTYSGNIAEDFNVAMVSVSGGHTTGTITFQTGTLSATNGTGLQFDNADGTYNFNGTTTLGGGDAGIDILNGSGGTFNFSSGASITNPANEVIKVNASTANVTYTGTFSKTNNSTSGILINGETGGTININGTSTKTITLTTGIPINLTSNTGATINFSGNNLLLNSTTGTGFNATGGGTISVTGTGNTITSTTGTALNVANTTIGGSGLTFQSISANGGTSTGIILDNTGASGGLVVTGDGTDVSVGGNSSGGIISNKSGSDLSRVTGCGIYLNNTSNVVLRRMTINGTNQNFGIRGFTVNNFKLEYSTVGGTNGTNPANNGADESGEGSVYFGSACGVGGGCTNGLTGTATLTNVNISGGAADNFSIVNISGSLNRLTVTGSTFGQNQNISGANINFSVNAFTAGTVVNVTVTGSTFLGSPSYLLNLVGQTGTTMDCVVGGAGVGNSFNCNHPINNVGGGGITFATQGVMTFNCSNNTIQGADGSAITIQKASAGTSMTGTLNANTIGVAATLKSGSKSGNGIFFSYAGTGTASMTITNNAIHQINGNGHIWADNTGGSYTANFTIEGNTLDTPVLPNWFAGIAITNGANTSGDLVNVCAKIGGTTAAEENTLNLSGNLGIIVGSSGANGGHTFNLPTYAGGANFTNVQNFIQANNTGSFTTQAYADAPATASAFTGTGTSCPQ